MGQAGTPAANPAGTPAAVKPRLRGRLHEVAFYASLAAGAALVGAAPPRHQLEIGVYAVSLSLLLGVSALYHRPTWPLRARAWMRRLDHSMIFLLIAGTYTAAGSLALEPDRASIVLALVWAGAGAGAALNLVWIGAPKAVSAVVYVALGWVALGVLPDLYRGLGAAAFTLLVAGGVVYSLGALTYALRRPDPKPGVVGYHEVFHALVVIAAACHYATIALALPG